MNMAVLPPRVDYDLWPKMRNLLTPPSGIIVSFA